MGLSLDVAQLAYLTRHDQEGATWFREDVAALNELLEAQGLPPHVEPEDIEPELLPHVSSFGYSWLHYLRRAYAHTRSGAPSFSPAPPHFDPQTDAMLDRELTLFMDSHLCCHSDAEGFYVPFELAEIVYGEIPGGMVGSSVALLRELGIVAPLLGVELDAHGEISIETARMLADTDESHPYFRERIVWGALFATASASVKWGTLLVFG
jgi:hypothetical protein